MGCDLRISPSCAISPIQLLVHKRGNLSEFWSVLGQLTVLEEAKKAGGPEGAAGLGSAIRGRNPWSSAHPIAIAVSPAPAAVIGPGCGVAAVVGGRVAVVDRGGLVVAVPAVIGSGVRAADNSAGGQAANDGRCPPSAASIRRGRRGNCRDRDGRGRGDGGQGCPHDFTSLCSGGRNDELRCRSESSTPTLNGN